MLEPKSDRGIEEMTSRSVLRSWWENYSRLLTRYEGVLDAINLCPIPDHDTGTNLRSTVASAAARLQTLPTAATFTSTCQEAIVGAALGCRGNSGTIFAEFARGLFGVLADSAGLSGVSLLEGWRSGATMSAAAVRDVLPGTMVTVAIEACADSIQPTAGPLGLHATIAELSQTGLAALEATAVDNADLSDYGVVDAGAAGLLLILDSLALALDCSEETSQVRVYLEALPIQQAWAEVTGTTHSCDVEVTFRLRSRPGLNRDDLLQALGCIGSSVVLSGPRNSVIGHLHARSDTNLRSLLEHYGTVDELMFRALLPDSQLDGRDSRLRDLLD